jgi:hypothetical protein
MFYRDAQAAGYTIKTNKTGGIQKETRIILFEEADHSVRSMSEDVDLFSIVEDIKDLQEEA